MGKKSKYSPGPGSGTFFNGEGAFDYKCVFFMVGVCFSLFVAVLLGLGKLENIV